MKPNAKKFDAYVMLSTFARAIIEVYIPVLMLKGGYSVKNILLYFLMMNTISFILCYPFAYLSKHISHRVLAVIAIFSFIALQFTVASIPSFLQFSTPFQEQIPAGGETGSILVSEAGVPHFGAILCLFLIALFYSVYKRCYWISRRFYTLHIVHKKHIGKVFAIISVLNQLSVMTATFIGSVFLDNLNIYVVIVISACFFLSSMIPLCMMKLKHEVNNIKLDLRGTLRKIPKADLYMFGSFELLNAVKFLFPLYITLYVKDSFQTIGVVTLITDVAIIIFSYLFGKKLDNSNNNFLRLSIILVVLTYLMKANSGYIALMIVSFIEGFTTKMYEISISRQFHVLSKKFEYNNYNLAYEMAQNFVRLLAALIVYLSPFGLRASIYIVLDFILLGAFLKFKLPKLKDFDCELDNA